MARVKTQRDSVAEAWKHLERALEAADSEWTAKGHMVRSISIEMAMADVRDELVQAGILDSEDF